MSFGTWLLHHLYGMLLRLYPRGFRAEFGVEMEAVFAEAVAGAAARGWIVLVGLLLRELRDWPGALLRAHWRALGKERMMGEAMENAVGSSNETAVLEDRHAPVPWREALPAGLPHALVALSFLLLGVARSYGLLPFSGQAISLIETGLGVVFVLSGVVALGVAWRRGWPHWSASWFAYAFVLVVTALDGALGKWKLPLGSWRLGLMLPEIYLRLLVPLLLALMLYALVLRDRLKLLLTVLPLLLVVWTLGLEFSLHTLRSVVELGAWLGAAGVAVLVARSGSVRKGIWVALAFTLVVGLAYTYVRTYHAQFPPDAPAHYHAPPTLSDWLNRFVLGMLVTAIVVLEPLLVRRLWVLGRRSGALGTAGFRLSLVGLMLLLAAALTASWWLGSGFRVLNLAWGYEVAKGAWLTLLAYVSIPLCLAGVAVLGVAVGRAGQLSGEVALLFLTFALLVMPLVVALPIAYDFWEARAIPKIWSYVLGLPWLASGVWLVTRRSAGRIAGAAA